MPENNYAAFTVVPLGPHSGTQACSGVCPKVPSGAGNVPEWLLNKMAQSYSEILAGVPLGEWALGLCRSLPSCRFPRAHQGCGEGALFLAPLMRGLGALDSVAPFSFLPVK